MFLLADAGYSPYATMITTQTSLVQKNPDLVQRFVNASIEGWYNYLYGDNKAANDLIKKDNPDMTDEQIAYSIAKMKEYGIVESGDAIDKGIGCITDAHYKKFFDQMVQIKLFDADTDYKKAFDLAVRLQGCRDGAEEVSSVPPPWSGEVAAKRRVGVTPRDARDRSHPGASLRPSFKGRVDQQ